MASREFEERKELIKIQKKADLEKHKLQMIQLEYKRENNKLFHDRELTRIRIKTAEIRRSQQRQH